MRGEISNWTDSLWWPLPRQRGDASLRNCPMRYLVRSRNTRHRDAVPGRLARRSIMSRCQPVLYAHW